MGDYPPVIRTSFLVKGAKNLDPGSETARFSPTLSVELRTSSFVGLKTSSAECGAAYSVCLHRRTAVELAGFLGIAARITSRYGGLAIVVTIARIGTRRQKRAFRFGTLIVL
jgi:hypothetical protein